MSYGQLAEKLLGIKTARETITHSAVSDIVSNADGSITRNIVNTEITALIGNRTNSDETSTLHVIVSTKTLENIGLADYIIHANRRWTVDKIIKDATGSGWSLYCSFETEGSLVPVTPIDPVCELDLIQSADTTIFRWSSSFGTFDEDLTPLSGTTDGNLLTWSSSEGTFDESDPVEDHDNVITIDTIETTWDSSIGTFDQDLDCILGTFGSTVYTWDTTEIDFDTDFV